LGRGWRARQAWSRAPGFVRKKDVDGPDKPGHDGREREAGGEAGYPVGWCPSWPLRCVPLPKIRQANFDPPAGGELDKCIVLSPKGRGK